MSDRIPSIADITDWLINNPTKTNKRGRKVPTGVPDAARALGYKGPTLKIREGNLTNGRQNIRISLKGKSSRSDYFRAQAQARTTPDKSVRAGANQKIKSINGQSSVINTADHILSNGALANGEEFVRATRGEEGVRQMRARYKKAGVGYGHSKENIQGLTKGQNGEKEIQERTLRGNNKNKTAYLQHLENKPPVTSPKFKKWDQKRQQFANKINPPRRSTGVPVIDFVLSRSKPTPTPKPTPKPNAGVNLILTAAGPQTKRNPTNRRPPRTLGTLTRVGNALDSRSSGSDIVDGVNGDMHLSNPHLAELGFELF